LTICFVEEENVKGTIQWSILGIILNELLTNTMKHAFVGRNTGLIDISLSKQENGVTLIIKDSGVGIREKGEETSNRFGLNLLRMLVNQLGGTLRIERVHGTVCTLKFMV
jgi:two-component system, sensor histidine kinase PdtaS